MSFVLPTHVENLTLLGFTAIDGTGNARDNVIVGNGRGNLLKGGKGADTLRGEGGDDRLFGGAGRDVLDGGDLDDFLDGGAGADVMRGGRNADTYVLDQRGDRVIELESGGIDTIMAPFTFRLTAQLEHLTLIGRADADGFGTSFGNDLIGNRGDNRLEGRGGNDQISGGRGDDRLFGGADVDTMDGGRGNDLLEGGADGDILTGGLGRDLLRGGPGVDQLDGGGDADQLFGGDDLDFLDGGDGADQLFGGDGSDQLDGGAGADLLDGGAGNDVLRGGAGDDLLLGGDGVDQYSGGAGHDMLSYAGEELSIEIDLLRGIIVIGRGTGQQFQEFAQEMESVTGGRGDDLITGDALANELRGGRGADQLTGAAGDDHLAGGQGADVFVFQALGQGVDRIEDLDLGEGDRLDLSELLTGFVPGAELADFVRLTSTGDDTTVAVAPNGIGGFTAIAVLEGVSLELADVSPAQLGL